MPIKKRVTDITKWFESPLSKKESITNPAKTINKIPAPANVI